MTIHARQDETRGETLVPPRPNLGPDPWPEDQGTRIGAAWFIASLALVITLIGIRLRNRRQARRRPEAPAPLPGSNDEGEPSPRQRLIAHSEAVREALVRGFGSPWSSKTTEEIGGEPRLIDRLEPAEFDRLIAFLRLADRAKFAEDEPDSLEEWDFWAVSIIERLNAPAGPDGSRRARRSNGPT